MFYGIKRLVRCCLKCSLSIGGGTLVLFHLDSYLIGVFYIKFNKNMRVGRFMFDIFIELFDKFLDLVFAIVLRKKR